MIVTVITIAATLRSGLPFHRERRLSESTNNKTSPFVSRAPTQKLRMIVLTVRRGRPGKPGCAFLNRRRDAEDITTQVSDDIIVRAMC